MLSSRHPGKRAGQSDGHDRNPISMKRKSAQVRVLAGRGLRNDPIAESLQSRSAEGAFWIGKKIAVVGKLDRRDLEQPAGCDLIGDQGIVQSHLLAVDNGLDADVGIGDDKVIAGRSIGQLRRLVPIPPRLAAVAIMQQGQIRKRRRQAGVCQAPGDRPASCRKGRAGEQPLYLHIRPVTFTPADGHVDALRAQINEIDQRLQAQTDSAVLRDEGHEPGRQPARREICRHADRDASLVFGDVFLEENCVIQGNINVNSPLVYDHVMPGALKAYARANQSVVVSPFILGGAIGPVTQPALLAQAHAEAMAGIALSQLVRKGAPVVYGNFLTTMNLKTGAPTFATPEANLSTFAIAQLCRRLDLPLRCGGHLTASKVADGQAMQESATSMMAGILAGSNFIFNAAGWLESGLTMGYEKFVIDLDHCGMMLHMLGGLAIDDDSLAADAFREAGPGETFLGTAPTLAHFETANYLSDLADTTSNEQ